MTGREFLETLRRSSGGSSRDREKKITATMVLLVTPRGMSTFYFAEQRTLKPVINHTLERRGALAAVHKPPGFRQFTRTDCVQVGESEQRDTDRISVFSFHGTACAIFPNIRNWEEEGRQASPLVHPNWKHTLSSRKVKHSHKLTSTSSSGCSDCTMMRDSGGVMSLRHVTNK